MTQTIRNATLTDAATITEIYNHAVAHTTAIWNETIVDVQNRKDWITERQDAGFPILVSENAEGQVTGYATYGPWRLHEGYRHTVEHSVYVHPDHQRLGLGRHLMHALLAKAEEAKVHIMIAGIDASNESSIRLHEQLGFQASAPLPEVGTKFGRWLDLVFMWKKIEG